MSYAQFKDSHKDFFLQQKFEKIKTYAYFEGKVNKPIIAKFLGVTESSAESTFSHYRAIYTKHFVYCKSKRRYYPTNDFFKHVTPKLLTDYSALQETNQESINPSEIFPSSSLFELLPRSRPNIHPKLMHNLIAAAKLQQRMEVDYRSLKSSTGNNDGRIIAPHSFFEIDSRTYVRAWCEKNQKFVDFVLSRFFSDGKVEGDCCSDYPGLKINDTKWLNEIQVIIVPDERLSPAQQELIELDWGMIDHKLVINSREALVSYVTKYFRLDLDTLKAEPEAQQIRIQNLQEVKHWVNAN